MGRDRPEGRARRRHLGRRRRAAERVALGIGRRSAPRAESTFINFVWEALRERGRGAEGGSERESEEGGGRTGEGGAGGRGREAPRSSPLRRSVLPNARWALSPELGRACERSAPGCSSPRGTERREGGRGRRPLSRSPFAKCSRLHQQAACSVERTARPAAAGGCRCPGSGASGSPCPCGAGPRVQSKSRFRACRRLDALGLAAAGARRFEPGPPGGSTPRPSAERRPRGQHASQR